jgi:hypothetical protein
MRFGLLVCVLVTCACGADQPRPDPTARPAAVAPAPSDDLAQALGVLRAWDDRRATAWRERDPAALRALYVQGSSALTADLRLLRAYTGRGLVVRRLETQVFGARVLQRSPGVLRLRVHDRTSATVRGTAGSDTVRGSDPVQRDLELRRVGGDWRMARIGRSD